MCTLKQSQTPDCNVPVRLGFGAGLIDLLVILGVTQRPVNRRSALYMTCLDAPQPTSAPRRKTCLASRLRKRNHWSIMKIVISMRFMAIKISRSSRNSLAAVQTHETPKGT